MRDAESMLDQLLTSGHERLTAEHVRELLGIVDADTVDAFVSALVTGDALAGMRILQDLEDRGRDLRAFLNQVVEALRIALMARLTVGGRGGPPPDALAAAARRLAAIDPNRAGPGGLRFQLELALLAPGTAAPAAQAPVPTRTPVPAAPPDPPAAVAATAEPAPAAKPRTQQRTQAPTPPERSAAEEPAPPPGAGNLAEIHRAWPEIVVWIGQRSLPAKALIDVCRPISFEGNLLTLGFPEKMRFHKDASERRRPIVEEGVSHFLGRPIGVRFVAANVEAAPPEQSAVDLMAKAREIFGDDLAEVGEVN
jgi:DNA polymerase-3 subunit gamma/tau